MTLDTRLLGTIFVATLPLLVTALGILGAIVWNLVSLRELSQKLDALTEKVSSIDKRLAVLEERDRWMHPVIPAHVS